MESSQPSPFTVAYLSSLSTALAPYATLSRSTSRALSALTSAAGLATPVRPETKCGHCGAELLGGLNASFSVGSDALLVKCGACGEVTRRKVEREEDDRSNRGRLRFPRVKRRQVKLRIAAQRSQPAKADPPATSARPAAATVRPNAPAPAPSQAQPPHAKSTATTRATTPASALSPAPTTSRATAPPTAAKTAPTADGGAGKKRKRNNKPAGLAEMLEAKKRAAATGTSKLGLQDFLGGI